MLIPATPKDLGFNAELYPEWRKYQLEAATDTLTSLKTVDLVTLDMPVGTGKTLVGLTIARMFLRDKDPSEFKKVVILTGTKGLQDQYIHDVRGSNFRLADMRGANNYPCHALNRKEFSVDIIRRFNPYGILDIKCDHGPCAVKIPCGRKAAGCDLYEAYDNFKRAPLGITNYSLWLLRTLSNADLLICDEGHLIESEIDKAARITLKDVPSDDIKKAQAWAVKRDWQLRNKEITIHIRNERRQLKRLIDIQDFDNWVYVEDKDSKGWAPKFYSNEGDLLAESAAKIVIMSGTTSRVDISRFRNSIRERKLTWSFKEYPSQFPIENRRVYCYPLKYNGVNVNVNFKNRPEVTAALLNHNVAIVNAMRPDSRKGIIHSVSYDRAEKIVERLHKEGHKNIFYPNTAKHIAKELKGYRENVKGGILVSPSVTTGFDFYGDLCRWQIICKLPFPSTVNPIIAARNSVDPHYSTAQAIKVLAQAVGRGVRAIDDWCDTFIPDNSILWAIFEEGLAPKWLIESFLLIDDVKFSQLKVRI